MANAILNFHFDYLHTSLILNLDLIKNIDSHNATLPTPETKYELRQALFLKMKY